jgi:hypothetical protein
VTYDDNVYLFRPSRFSGTLSIFTTKVSTAGNSYILTQKSSYLATKKAPPKLYAGLGRATNQQ